MSDEQYQFVVFTMRSFHLAIRYDKFGFQLNAGHNINIVVESVLQLDVGHVPQKVATSTIMSAHMGRGEELHLK